MPLGNLGSVARSGRPSASTLSFFLFFFPLTVSLSAPRRVTYGLSPCLYLCLQMDLGSYSPSVLRGTLKRSQSAMFNSGFPVLKEAA